MLAAAAVAGCSRGGEGDAPPPRHSVEDGPTPTEGRTRQPRASARTPEATPDPTPEPTAEPTADPTGVPEALPAVEPYEPLAGEVHPNAKRRAGRIAQELATYSHDETIADATQRATGSDDAETIDIAQPLHHPGANATGQVVYAQLGGLDPHDEATSCSVMVILRQRVSDGGEPRSVTRVLDVRLATRDGEWAFERLASAGGEEVPRPPDLSEAAKAVLDDDRIDLPDTARWDIHASLIDERLLEAMRWFAEQAPYRVSSLVTGHPTNVFGTSRQSNHAVGRAVDVWAVDSEPVVTQQPEQRGAVWDAVNALFDEGIVESIGSPWALDEVGGLSFSDPVHLDHLHLGFHSSA